MKHKPSRKVCHKVGYKTPQEARKALKEFGQERGSKRFYKCPHHDTEMYHLTSENKP